MSKKKKEKLSSPRNTIAIAAKFRNSAGSMKINQETDDTETLQLHCNNRKTCLLEQFSQNSEGCSCRCDVCCGVDP